MAICAITDSGLAQSGLNRSGLKTDFRASGATGLRTRAPHLAGLQGSVTSCGRGCLDPRDSRARGCLNSRGWWLGSGLPGQPLGSWALHGPSARGCSPSSLGSTLRSFLLALLLCFGADKWVGSSPLLGRLQIGLHVRHRSIGDHALVQVVLDVPPAAALEGVVSFHALWQDVVVGRLRLIEVVPGNPTGRRRGTSSKAVDRASWPSDCPRHLLCHVAFSSRVQRDSRDTWDSRDYRGSDVGIVTITPVLFQGMAHHLVRVRLLAWHGLPTGRTRGCGEGVPPWASSLSRPG